MHSRTAPSGDSRRHPSPFETPRLLSGHRSDRHRPRLAGGALLTCPRCQHENPTDATFCDEDVSPRQARLIFSPPRVVDLGAVPNSGSGARYLAIHGKRHVAKCPSERTSRTPLPCPLHVKGYGAYRLGVLSRGGHVLHSVVLKSPALTICLMPAFLDPLMVKLVFCLTRLSHLSREEFQRYWRDRHGPLVREVAEALAVRRYVQVHTLTSPLNEGLRRGRNGPDEYDGVAELWFDRRDAPRAGGSSSLVVATAARSAGGGQGSPEGHTIRFVSCALQQ